MVMGLGCFLLAEGCAAVNRQMEFPESDIYVDKQQASPQQPVKEDARADGYFLFLSSQMLKNQGRLDEAIDTMKMAIDREPDSVYLQMELAVLYLQKKDNPNALQVVEAILKKYPDNVDALVMAATIKKTLDKNADVKSLYERVLLHDPNRKSVYQVLGKLYFTEGDYDKAADVYTKMIRRFPDDYVGYYYMGEIYGVQGKYDKAEEAFLKTLSLSPSLVESRLELVKLYRLTRQQAKEIAMYEEIYRQFPDNITVAMELALLYHQANPAAADELLRSLGERSRGDANVIGAVIQHLVLEKRIDDAIVVLSGMSRGAPESSEIAYAAGIVYHEKGNARLALENLSAVSPGSRFYQNAVVHMAVIYYAIGAFDRGIAMLENAMLELPDSDKVGVIPYLTSFYKEKDRLEDAVDLLESGLEIDPANTDLLLELGVILDRQGKTDAAIEKMKTILSLKPDHADALNYIGYTYADRGVLLDEAEAMIRKALAQKPDNGFILDSLGWVLYKKGRYAEALVEMEKAVALVPDDQVILEHCGDVHAKLNHREKALEYYQRALAAAEKDREKILEKIRVLQSEPKGEASP